METSPAHGAQSGVEIFAGGHSARRLFPITAFSWLAASLLILLGAAFELGMLGFGPYNSSGVLLLFVVGKNAWAILAELAFPELREFVKIWPLVLVVLGASILFVAQCWNRFESVAVSSGRKENHANRT